MQRKTWSVTSLTIWPKPAKNSVMRTETKRWLESCMPAFNIMFRTSRGIRRTSRGIRRTRRRTLILKFPLLRDSSLYELNSIKIACKCVPLIKPKPIPIVFIWLKEGPLWPTSVHAQGPQLFVSKPKWHAPSIVVKRYYGVVVTTRASKLFLGQWRCQSCWRNL